MNNYGRYYPSSTSKSTKYRKNAYPTAYIHYNLQIHAQSLKLWIDMTTDKKNNLKYSTQISNLRHKIANENPKKISYFPRN